LLQRPLTARLKSRRFRTEIQDCRELSAAGFPLVELSGHGVQPAKLTSQARQTTKNDAGPRTEDRAQADAAGPALSRRPWRCLVCHGSSKLDGSTGRAARVFAGALRAGSSGCAQVSREVVPERAEHKGRRVRRRWMRLIRASPTPTRLAPGVLRRVLRGGGDAAGRREMALPRPGPHRSCRSSGCERSRGHRSAACTARGYGERLRGGPERASGARSSTVAVLLVEAEAAACARDVNFWNDGCSASALEPCGARCGRRASIRCRFGVPWVQGSPSWGRADPQGPATGAPSQRGPPLFPEGPDW
jgi:hypothetical protein